MALMAQIWLLWYFSLNKMAPDVCQNQVDQLRILFCIFNIDASMKNLKRTPLRSLQCKKCLLRDFETKRTRRSNQQRFSIRILSFRLWLQQETCDNQLRISDHNFSINSSMTNPKQASLRTLQCEKCLLREFETKRTR